MRKHNDIWLRDNHVVKVPKSINHGEERKSSTSSSEKNHFQKPRNDLSLMVTPNGEFNMVNQTFDEFERSGSQRDMV
jgi:hypothetical protein